MGRKVEDIFCRRTAVCAHITTTTREDLWNCAWMCKEEVANRLGLNNATIARSLAGSFQGAAGDNVLGGRPRG